MYRSSIASDFRGGAVSIMGKTAKYAGFLSFFLAVSTILSTGGTAYANESTREQKSGISPAAPLASTTDKDDKTDAIAATDSHTVSSNIKPGLAGSFLSSRFAKQHENLNEAAKYLKDSLARDPNNIRLKHEVMRSSLLAGDIPQAITLAKQLNDEAKTDALVATLLMLDAVKQKDYVGAQSAIAAAPSSGLFGIVKPLMTRWLVVGAGKVTGPIDMQAAIDKAGFFAPFLTYHVALMNDVAGFDKVAKDNYLKATSSSDTAPYRVVEAFANFYARHGKWDEAQKLFDNYARVNPDSSLLPGKITPQTEPVRPLVADADEGMAEVFFTTASILFGEDASQDTFLYLRIALDLRPELPPAQLMLANLYEQSGDFAKAIATYDSMSKGTVFYRRGQVRKALNLEAMGKRDEAIRYLDGISQQYPNDAIALITKGDMLRVQEKYKEASDAYSEAVTRSEPLKESDWPLLYARGISYERAGQWPKAEADFQRALKLEPNQPDVLNYLAYSWLTMGKNVVKARNYLEIALSARPDEPHIIDSLGMAKLLTGEYKSAAADFEKAVEMLPEDPTVNDHLGDSYWRLGRQTEAKYQWNRALNSNPEADLAAALKHKLAEGLPPPQVITVEKPEIVEPSEDASALKSSADMPEAEHADKTSHTAVKKDAKPDSDAPDDDQIYE